MRRTGTLLAFAAASAALGATLAVVAACSGGGDVILATIPVEPEAGGTTPVRCNTTVPDCPANQYCDKAACGDTTGTCTAYPTDCEGVAHRPVCGCDGITYFDDCLRKAAGIESSSDQPCWPGVAVTCGGPAGGCPDGSLCFQVVGFAPGPCAPDIPGTCWVVPPTCPPPSAGADMWLTCPDQPGAKCLDTCTAIHDGGVYHRAQMCH